MVRAYLDWIADPNAPMSTGWYLTGGFFLLNIIKPILFNNGIRVCFYTCIKAEGLIRSLLLDKSLNLPAGSQYFLDFGRLSTLITSDLKKFTSSIMTRGQLFVGPVLLVLYTAVLWLQISWVALIAPVIIIVIAILQNKMNHSLFKINKEKMDYA